MSDVAPDPGRRWHRSTLATLALLAVTACWGSTFILIRDLLDRVPTADFLAVRFAIAAAVMTAIFPRAIPRLDPAARRACVLLGLVYGAAQILQTAGLAHTPASISGFVTGLYVVFTPLLAALVLRHRVGWITWAAVLLAAAGLAALTLESFSLDYGEAITLVGAVMYAVHIVGLGAWSRADQAVGMAIGQLWVIALLCLIAGLPGGLRFASNPQDWLAIVYMALVAGGLAMLAQTWAQAHLSATRSAIVMSTEPVWAAFFAIVVGPETLGVRQLTGGALVLVAMLVAELAPRLDYSRGSADLTHGPPESTRRE